MGQTWKMMELMAIAPDQVEVSAVPEINDIRIRVERINRFRWEAVVEQYTQPYERPKKWDAIHSDGYEKGWRGGWFRWWAVFRADLDLAQFNKELDKEAKRKKFRTTEIIKR